MPNNDKIKKLLSSIKLEVEDINKFEKDIDSILGMFNELNDIDVSEFDSNLNRKKIKISDLREDKEFNWEFKKDLRGKYLIVPSVSKK